MQEKLIKAINALRNEKKTNKLSLRTSLHQLFISLFAWTRWQNSDLFSYSSTSSQHLFWCCLLPFFYSVLLVVVVITDVIFVVALLCCLMTMMNIVWLCVVFKLYMMQWIFPLFNFTIEFVDNDSMLCDRFILCVANEFGKLLWMIPQITKFSCYFCIKWIVLVD